MKLMTLIILEETFLQKKLIDSNGQVVIIGETDAAFNKI